MNRTYFSKFQQCKDAHVKLFKKSAIHLLLHHESNTGLDKTTLIRIREMDVKNVPRNSPYVYISLYNDLTTEFSNIGYLSCNYSNSLFDFLSKRKTIQVPITYFSNVVQQSSRFGSGSDLGLGSGSGSGSGPTTETLNGIILGKRIRSDENVSLLDSDSETKNENSINLKRVRHDEKSSHQQQQQQQQQQSQLPSQLPLQFQYYSNESVSTIVKNLTLPFTLVQINLIKQRLDWFITSLVRREYLNRLKLKTIGLQPSSQPTYNANANANGENATDLAEKFHLWTSDRIQDDIWSFVVIALFINQQPIENPKILQHHLNLQQLWIQVEYSLLCLRINNKCILSHPHHFKLEHFEQHLTELGHQLSAIDTNLSSLKPLNSSSTYNIQKHLRQFISQWRPRYEWVGVDDDMEKKNPIAHWFPKFPSLVHINGKVILPGSKLYIVLPFTDDDECDAEEDPHNYGCIIQARPVFITQCTEMLGTKQTTIPKIRIRLVHEDIETQIRHMNMVAYLRECTRQYPEGADIPYQMEPGSTKNRRLDSERFNYAAYGGVPSPGMFYIPESEFIYMIYLSQRFPNTANVLSQFRTRVTPFYIDFDLTLKDEYIDITLPYTTDEGKTSYHSILTAMTCYVQLWLPTKMDVLVMSACGALDDGQCRTSYRINYFSTLGISKTQQKIRNGLVKYFSKLFGSTVRGVSWDLVFDKETHKDGSGSRAFLQESQKWVRCGICKEQRIKTRCPTRQCKLVRNRRPQQEFLLYIDRTVYSTASSSSSHSLSSDSKTPSLSSAENKDETETENETKTENEWSKIKNTTANAALTKEQQIRHNREMAELDRELKRIRLEDKKAGISEQSGRQAQQKSRKNFIQVLRESKTTTDKYPFCLGAEHFNKHLEASIGFSHFALLTNIRRFTPPEADLTFFVDHSFEGKYGRGSSNGGGGSGENDGENKQGGDGRGDWTAIPKDDDRRELIHEILSPILGPDVICAKVLERMRDGTELQLKGYFRAKSARCVHEGSHEKPYYHRNNRSKFFMTRNSAWLNDLKCEKMNRNAVEFSLLPSEELSTLFPPLAAQGIASLLPLSSPTISPSLTLKTSTS